MVETSGGVRLRALNLFVYTIARDAGITKNTALTFQKRRTIGREIRCDDAANGYTDK